MRRITFGVESHLRQIAVIPVSHAFDSYAQDVQAKLHESGFYVDADTSDLTLNKRIRNAEISHYTFICVVGAKEAETGTVNIRKATADGKDIVLTLNEAITAFKALEASKSRDHHL